MRKHILVSIFIIFQTVQKMRRHCFFSFESGVGFVIDDLRVDQSIRSPRALKPCDFRYLLKLYFRRLLLICIKLCVFGALFCLFMSSDDLIVPQLDPHFQQTMEDFKRRVLEQSRSSITEDLRRTLSYQVDPEENRVEIAGGSRTERVYDCGTDDEFIIAPELVEVLQQPPSC